MVRRGSHGPDDPSASRHARVAGGALPDLPQRRHPASADLVPGRHLGGPSRGRGSPAGSPGVGHRRNRVCLGAGPLSRWRAAGVRAQRRRFGLAEHPRAGPDDRARDRDADHRKVHGPDLASRRALPALHDVRPWRAGPRHRHHGTGFGPADGQARGRQRRGVPELPRGATGDGARPGERRRHSPDRQHRDRHRTGQPVVGLPVGHGGRPHDVGRADQGRRCRRGDLRSDSTRRRHSDAADRRRRADGARRERRPRVGGPR